MFRYSDYISAAENCAASIFKLALFFGRPLISLKCDYQQDSLLLGASKSAGNTLCINEHFWRFRQQNIC